jgi:hypothetical protein
MSVRWNTICRQAAKRFVVLGLVTLAPAVASARVPYQSKPRSADQPTTQAASPTPSEPAPEPAAPAPRITKPVADRPTLRPAGDDDPATASATCSASATSGLPTLGTAVHWMPTPDEAGKLAAKERKLVFLIQVSGNFARQEFT